VLGNSRGGDDACLLAFTWIAYEPLRRKWMCMYENEYILLLKLLHINAQSPYTPLRNQNKKPNVIWREDEKKEE
jgi:hypothetical protein